MKGVRDKVREGCEMLFGNGCLKGWVGVRVRVCDCVRVFSVCLMRLQRQRQQQNAERAKRRDFALHVGKEIGYKIGVSDKI